MCADRATEPAPEQRNGQSLSEEDKKRFTVAHSVPSCVKHCPAEALMFGEREELLDIAKKRIRSNSNHYVDHIYGEKEAGGTATFYLSSVPFPRIDMSDVGTASYPQRSAPALAAVPPAVVAVGALLGGTYALKRRSAMVDGDKDESTDAHAERHVEFAPLKKKLATPVNLLLLALAILGGVSFVLRFALGLGDSTNLSDTYPWGLWIALDLVWIAVAAGAFATAGLIYVLHRKDLYSMGRTAVLMGLLSYSFVTLTLLADLGLPWNFWQLMLQAPEHSAMFEVSWCVGLYVSVLAFEFFPVPFERWNLKWAMDLWRKFSPAYVVFAVTLFVYLMSRSLMYTGLAFAVFALMAYLFRQRDTERPVPIMLAIAAVTFSTMHQSSLGSLFLLMPDKLNPLWWSPMIPILFLLSSVAAGTALMVLVEMWIAKAYARPLRMPQLSALGKITFWALLVYGVVRVLDVLIRGQLPSGLAGQQGSLFIIEILLGVLLPLTLLASAKLRARRGLLAAGAFLVAGGVVFNRMNVVLFAMNLKGPIPQIIPEPYSPSLFEWGVSIGFIAATILLFGVGIRLMPVLPEEDEDQGA